MKNLRRKKKDGLTITGLWTFTLTDILTGEKKVFKKSNVIATSGKTMIANNLTSASPTNTMLINYFAVGTNATAPAAADTQLGTETYRKATSSYTNSANTAFLSGFLTATETSGTFREFGLFSNATGTANSGVLVSHVAINIVKSTNQTMTCDIEILIS
jgi:hypothetical protein